MQMEKRSASDDALNRLPTGREIASSSVVIATPNPDQGGLRQESSSEPCPAFDCEMYRAASPSQGTRQECPRTRSSLPEPTTTECRTFCRTRFGHREARLPSIRSP